MLNFEDRLARTLALGFERVKHIHNINHFPKPISHASGHRRAEFSVW